MSIEKLIRDLAKSSENQNKLIACKDLHSIRLFKNDSDLSKIQHLYLSYTLFYYDLMSDIYLKKVNEIVLTDPIYEDAYAHYKKQSEAQDKSKKKERDIHLVFDKPKKRNK